MISNRALVKSTMDWGSKAPAWTIISWCLRTYSSCHSIWIIKQTHSEHRLGRTLIKASSTKEIGKMNVPFDSFNRQKSLRTKNLLKKGNQWHVRQPWQQCIETGVFPAADAIIHLRIKAIAFPWDFSVSCAIFLASDNGPSNRRGYCSILPWGKSFYFIAVEMGSLQPLQQRWFVRMNVLEFFRIKVTANTQQYVFLLSIIDSNG